MQPGTGGRPRGKSVAAKAEYAAAGKVENDQGKSTSRNECSSSPLKSGRSQLSGQATPLSFGLEDSRNMDVDPSEPPVTKATLSELDVCKIIYNPKLRHDVNFDPDLHFRPNLDGEKGRKKSQRATDFWNRLGMQLEHFAMDRMAFENEYARCDWCLPATLRAIGDILSTLVPSEERETVLEILNVDLLMQQYFKSFTDLDGLTTWLSRTLKSHCAPMRDEWVDEMVMQLTTGKKSGDMLMLVQGLQTLLAVLEAMKLDVANHQIHCLRPLLIHDTIDFERTFVLKKIANGKVDAAAAHRWFLQSDRVLDTLPRKCHQDMWKFFKGLANLLSPSSLVRKLPDTFMFDDERLAKLRLDLLDVINLEVCSRLLGTLPGQQRTFKASNISRISTSFSISESETRTISKMVTGEASTAPLTTDFQKKVKESHIAKDKGHYVKSTFPDRLIWIPETEGVEIKPDSLSSSLSKLSLGSNVTKYPQVISHHPVLTEVKLSRDIAAILEDMPSDRRWERSISAIAVEILRSLKTDMRVLDSFEADLHCNISNTASQTFIEAESYILGLLYDQMDSFILKYDDLTPMQLFEIITASNTRPPNQHTSILVHLAGDQRGTISEIAKQIVHLGILHWRVWAPLVYLVDPDEETNDRKTAGATTTGSSDVY